MRAQCHRCLRIAQEDKVTLVAICHLNYKFNIPRKSCVCCFLKLKKAGLPISYHKSRITANNTSCVLRRAQVVLNLWLAAFKEIEIE